MRQKVFSLPTVGAPSASDSPSALSERAGQVLFLFLSLTKKKTHLSSCAWKNMAKKIYLYCNNLIFM